MAASQGISTNILDAARRSPVYKLAKLWQLALPLHPEFRTLPMVWYVPPLSPISERVAESDQSAAIDSLRIPMTYLANLLTAGDEAPVRLALKRLSAMRAYMRSDRIGDVADDAILESVGLTAAETRAIYELLALARFEDRFVIPTNNRTDETRLFINQGGCGFPEGI